MIDTNFHLQTKRKKRRRKKEKKRKKKTKREEKKGGGWRSSQKDAIKEVEVLLTSLLAVIQKEDTISE